MNWRDLVFLCVLVAVAAALVSRGRAKPPTAIPTQVAVRDGLTLDLPEKDVQVLTQQGKQAVIKVDMQHHTELDIELHFDSPSRDWSFNLGDSPSVNGYGGDSGDSSNDAEMEIVNGNLDVFASDQMVDGDKHILKNWPLHIAAGSTVKFRLRDGQLQGENGLSLNHPCIFALKGQPDREGSVNYDLFLGLNRVVAGGRVGSGVDGLKLRFSE